MWHRSPAYNIHLKSTETLELKLVRTNDKRFLILRTNTENIYRNIFHEIIIQQVSLLRRGTNVTTFTCVWSCGCGTPYYNFVAGTEKFEVCAPFIAVSPYCETMLLSPHSSYQLELQNKSLRSFSITEKAG